MERKGGYQGEETARHERHARKHAEKRGTRILFSIYLEREVAFALAIVDDFDGRDLLHAQIGLEIGGSLVLGLARHQAQVVGEETQISGSQLQSTVDFTHAQRHVLDVERVLIRRKKKKK